MIDLAIIPLFFLSPVSLFYKIVELQSWTPKINLSKILFVNNLKFHFSFQYDLSMQENVEVLVEVWW
jgi:hypothetical protein